MRRILPCAATRQEVSGGQFGGGGGTAFPTLSSRAGLYLHPVLKDAGRVIHPLIPDESSLARSRVSESMSLYRASLRLALYLPLGIALVL